MRQTPRASSAAVSVSPASDGSSGGPPAIGASAYGSAVPLIVCLQEGARRNEVYEDTGEARLSARSMETRLAILSLGGKVERLCPARRRCCAEPDRSVDQRPPQSVEQGFLRRPAGIRLEKFLVPARPVLLHRRRLDHRGGLSALPAPDFAYPLA